MKLFFKIGRCFGWIIDKLSSAVHQFFDGIDDYLLGERIKREDKLMERARK